MTNSNLNNIMQQAQKMQEKMKEAQESLSNLEITGESGAGMVNVVMTGKHDVKSINIDPSLMSENKEMLEDLVAAAVNDAVRKVESENKKYMGDAASGMGLPSDFKWPF